MQGNLDTDDQRMIWASGRSWVGYGIRKNLNVDAVYWAAIHMLYDEKLEESLEDESEGFIGMKMKQSEAHNAPCRIQIFKLTKAARQHPLPI